ncbi:N-acetylmuramoyl-L-alanine amidase [Caloramator proteoclasticus]|uniref:N-acetylmuramoyl-L-alanine amidase n=1 Tax=Caloramator proteoclasticus DSM 10124 TaxID=1121262 RepID=A0A1M5ATH3_9CLOT|nr:N-acetylmuramoyl-L-alanine amidase [Caloramator proteoclasticus]SHF33568.1 N-acetylmuramoyl-L-alanine amidase [Caloramator proteoclasticus DSM 10124]
MARVCLDYGHGGEDSGAVYGSRKEKDDNLALGLKVAEELRRHGVFVSETRTSDTTLSLKDRTLFANRGNFDYFISFHRNAYIPEKTNGVETYVYIIGREKSKELAERIQKALIQVGFFNRGIKKANFQVLRETKMPAVLVEVGFIDNSEDNKLFDSKKDEIAKGIAKAILEQLNIKYVETSKILYRVAAGTFSNRENAEKQVRKLKELGIDAVIVEVK